MDLPAVRGVIDRRILVNYRVEPDALAAALPDPFEPQLVNGYGVGGICLIRLRTMRPAGVPAALGLASENAAHRIGVTWETDDGRETGVYVPRRDTSSRLNAAFGDRLFGGDYGHAAFEVDEADGEYRVEMRSDDGEARVSVAAQAGGELPEESVFDSLDDASAFFRNGSVGYAPRGTDEYAGVELCTDDWAVEALAVDSVSSSYFEDEARFPPGAVTFDDALLMRGIEHEWRGRESICAPRTVRAP